MFKRFTSICLLLAVLLSLVVLPAKASDQPQEANVALGKTVTFTSGGEVTTGDGNYGLAAVNAGLGVLTDGISRSANWWVNNGNPYVALKSSVITGPYSFTVDLGGIIPPSRSDWSIYPAASV